MKRWVIAMSKQNMEEILRKKGRVVTTAVGISMLPCIQPQKDILVLEKSDRINVLDVVLFRRKNGSYVLHRVLDIQPEGYVLCGDSQYKKEYGVENEQILGILKGFYRGEKYIDCEKNRWYKMYVNIWCSSLILRKGILQCGRILWKIKRKMNL